MNFKKLLLFVAVGVFSFGGALAQTKQIKTAKITFEFPSKDVAGSISGFESKSKLDFDNLENSVLEGSVAVETLDTNNGLRNWSLKGRRYFDEDEHPRIHYKSKSIKAQQEKYLVTGVLRLKGIEKPLEILFSKNGNTLTGHTELYSSDFGINIKKQRQDNLVKVTLVFEID